MHIGAVIQQQVGDGQRCRLVERLLPIPSARVHERGIRGQQRPELVDPAQPRGHVRRQFHAAREEKPCRLVGGVVQDGVGSVLPLAVEVEVGPRGDQHLEHGGAFRGDVRGTLTEREHRRVDMVLDMRQSEEPPDRGGVTTRHPVAEGLDVALLQLLDEHRPRVETGFARDGELGVRELRRACGAGVRANGFSRARAAGSPSLASRSRSSASVCCCSRLAGACGC